MCIMKPGLRLLALGRQALVGVGRRSTAYLARAPVPSTAPQKRSVLPERLYRVGGAVRASAANVECAYVMSGD